MSATISACTGTMFPLSHILLNSSYFVLIIVSSPAAWGPDARPRKIKKPPGIAKTPAALLEILFYPVLTRSQKRGAPIRATTTRSCRSFCRFWYPSCFDPLKPYPVHNSQPWVFHKVGPGLGLEGTPQGKKGWRKRQPLDKATFFKRYCFENTCISLICFVIPRSAVRDEAIPVLGREIASLRSQ
jgi:hypothetical protein